MGLSKRWVFVAHQHCIGRDPNRPAVHPHVQAEHGGWVTAGEQQRSSGEEYDDAVQTPSRPGPEASLEDPHHQKIRYGQYLFHQDQSSR